MTGEEFNRWLPIYKDSCPGMTLSEIKDQMYAEDKLHKEKEQENVGGDGI